jgi:hypothetical protein
MNEQEARKLAEDIARDKDPLEDVSITQGSSGAYVVTYSLAETGVSIAFSSRESWEWFHEIFTAGVLALHEEEGRASLRERMKIWGLDTRP